MLAKALHGHGVGTVVITLGGDGALICDDDGVRSVPAVPAREVVDTTGAGDAFTAALSVALAEGKPTDGAVRFAAAAGAHAVTIAEVIPSLARRPDIEGLESE
jgi:ribokinase